MGKREVLAIDMDDCLSLTSRALLEFHNHYYSTSLTPLNFTSFNYWLVWGGTEEESTLKTRQFYACDYFKKLLEPMPGALEVLQRLVKSFDLYVVTARQQFVEQETREWLDRYFPNIFKDVLFANHYLTAEEMEKFNLKPSSKSAICREIGAKLLVDDSLSNALECAQVGIPIVLFDWNHSYYWNKTAFHSLPSNVVRVFDWSQIEALISPLIHRHDSISAGGAGGLLTLTSNDNDTKVLVVECKKLAPLNHPFHPMPEDYDVITWGKSFPLSPYLGEYVASSSHSVDNNNMDGSPDKSLFRALLLESLIFSYWPHLSQQKKQQHRGERHLCFVSRGLSLIEQGSIACMGSSHSKIKADGSITWLEIETLHQKLANWMESICNSSSSSNETIQIYLFFFNPLSSLPSKFPNLEAWLTWLQSFIMEGVFSPSTSHSSNNNKISLNIGYCESDLIFSDQPLPSSSDDGSIKPFIKCQECIEKHFADNPNWTSSVFRMRLTDILDLDEIEDSLLSQHDVLFLDPNQKRRDRMLPLQKIQAPFLVNFFSHTSIE